MRVLVIGGTGHIGTYLTPRLVQAGHSVVNVSRAQRSPYSSHAAWSDVEQLTADRNSEEQAGSFGRLILGAKPDAVIDLTCYTLESARHLVEALRGQISHFLHCGTIWVHGVSTEVPITEDAKREPFGDYGIRKEAIERYLLTAARRDGFPATILHPGHLVGRGWVPLNPVGNFNPAVFVDLAKGREIAMPNLGRECVHHVHADDVAQAFVKALANWSVAAGESFHVVRPGGLNAIRIRASRGFLVRCRSKDAFRAMGRMEAIGNREGSAGYLGPYCAVVELQYRKGAASTRVSAPLPFYRSHPRIRDGTH